ncbi:hypothetical protein GCM10022415_15510 [Knoellia locipacati]|uniref:Anti-sigma factor n=1 Tax=Knoellia locipacati TaxID=882824 RepID=A0A512T002_9MICO|nr:anti-sigma factor [Knoellia locipacati]GEQ13501.1 hypothetical protein KLO01_15480 [Knoellia locipacati]
MTRPPTRHEEDVVHTEHLADERLVDLTLDDDALAHEREHLASCAACRGTLADLTRVVDIAREAPTVELVTPGPGLWARIVEDLDGSDVGERIPPRDAAPASLQPEARPDVAVLPAPAESSSSPEVVVPLRREHRDREHPVGRVRPALTWLAAACAAGILLGAGGVVVADRLQSGSGAGIDVIRTVATAELDTLDTRQRLGTATVSERAGELNLAVSATELDRGDSGYVEVWLINRDGKRMVSVGVLDEGATAGAFPVSRQLLDEGYVVVDLSREQFDDKPQHSGDSIVRGLLRTPV